MDMTVESVEFKQEAIEKNREPKDGRRKDAKANKFHFKVVL